MKYEFEEILELSESPFHGDVCDIEVDQDHSYTVENIIVHNSACTTRIKTGIGFPQLTSIIECADAAHGSNAYVCADGGCRTSGDIVKAFAAGADMVMIGGMLAGTKESSGKEVVDEITGEVRKEFYGMSSEQAMNIHDGGMSDYKTAEGKSVTVTSKGSAREVIRDIKGGIRSACAYVGAEKLKDLSKCTTFIKVNRTHNTVFG